MIPAITTEMGISKPHMVEVVVETCASCVSGEHWEQLGDNLEISSLEI